ncbi:hypothetical protein BKE38_22370 [Pseudoroseomonas deserti]|uniref:Uncharacterized protein n=1 Tax=Teichococcus deserti TaxID=1817963 RepID=A0A1V2GWV3_9PROT|nr:hypothetical protein [Pseudoroseomonas deserti]ONG47966.1 hypothetical protein BKE38_22370 [Pseudoroseomonas deserti]
MELSKILGLRPKLQNAESIAAAISQAEALQAQAISREAELKASRGALLISGNAKEVEAGERELAEVRAEAERLGVMVEALKPKLLQAQKEEKSAAFRKKLAEADRLAAEFVELWTTRYPGLEAEIQAMRTKARETNEMLRDLSEEFNASMDLQIEHGDIGKKLMPCFQRLDPNKYSPVWQ